MPANLRAKTVERAKRFLEAHGRRPRLDVIIVDNHPASRSYVWIKTKQAVETGIDGRLIELPETIAGADLLAEIDRLNSMPDVDGNLVQLSLPNHLGSAERLEAISPQKDVGGFHPVNVGRLLSSPTIDPQRMLTPCTPLGIANDAARHVGPDGMSGKHAVIIGRSNIVGKPMAHLLLASHCTVTIAHSRAQDLPELCRTADILVAAFGRPEMVRGAWIKEGATVIDVGIRVPSPDGKGGFVGDVASAEVRKVAHFLTPVPDGVGRMTAACLLHNTVVAAETRTAKH